MLSSCSTQPRRAVIQNATTRSYYSLSTPGCGSVSLCALSIDDLNLRERFVTIRGETSKSQKRHDAAIGFETAKALERYKQDFREESKTCRMAQTGFSSASVADQ
jgi:integrase